MTQVTIKIELSGLDKALTEVKALETYIRELAKTYPTEFTQEVATPPQKAVKAPKKAVKAEPIPTPTPTPKEAPKAPESKSEVTQDMLKEEARGAKERTDLMTVKKCIARYGAKLSDVTENNFTALYNDLKSL